MADLRKWADDFVKNTDLSDIDDVNRFRIKSKKHIKYKEGNYFRIKIGRDHYTYGRLLMDVYKRQHKDGFVYMAALMGHALIVEVFHIITKRKDITIEELNKLKTFPSLNIMDNCLFYGDYEIIGYDPIPNNVSFPIIFGEFKEKDGSRKLFFQSGFIFKTLPYNGVNDIGQFFGPCGVSFAVCQTKRIIEECINDNSNNPYYKYYKLYNDTDLRSPANRDALIRILKLFNIDLSEIGLCE